ncbi:conserved exported hypothetical protein [Candidatus Sulfotelmatomonas gaucii]|uniref:Uncharacterized protein n=1 Tax=Candidatus Sulfuritelmatomonas gaucii TaxID=2043161 RepID=A0A2N9LGU0_9BACT|nr:conserved exported hypothetical protein [Candidatus Sulfotelmatomonas gaucii]
MSVSKYTVILALLAMVPALRAEGALGGDSSVAKIYVSPAGNNNWSGLLPAPNAAKTDGPFRTFDHARLYVEGLDKLKLSQVVVQFREGIYTLTQPVNFVAADSGSAATEIVYENYPGETPIISGGMRVTGWVNVGDNKWQVMLPAGTAKFENLYYNGARRLRPRVGGYLGTYFRFLEPIYLTKMEHDLELQQFPDRTDNCPHVDTSGDNHDGEYECFDRFTYDVDPKDNNNPHPESWTNLAPSYENFCKANEGAPSQLGEIEILDFEQFSTSKLPVSCIDTANRIIYLTGTTATPGGPHSSEVGFIKNDRYLVENVENALTEPGQWYLDPKTLQLTYLSQGNEDPNRDAVVVPQALQLLIASGLHDVTFRGLTFQHDNYVLPYPAGHKSTELEPDIPAAVSFQNSSRITFDSDTVRQIGGVGLDFISCVTDPSSDTNNSEAPFPECVSPIPNPSVEGNVIENSAFYDIGALGVRIGDPYLATDEDWNVPAWNVVENNVVEGYGRTVPASFGIGQGFGHNNLYTHNDVYDGYHCAISLSQNAGNTDKPNGVGEAYNTISFNHVYNLLQGIMNDGGSIRVDAGVEQYTAPGNRIWNNKIHDVTDSSIIDPNGYGGHGIYMDNQTGLVDVENNLVYRVSDAAIYTPHGPQQVENANLIKNNILAYARVGMIEEGDSYLNGVPTSAANVPRAFVVTNNLMYFDRNINSTSPFDGVATLAPFNVDTGCTYTPFAYPLYQEFESNLYWRTDGTFASDPNAFVLQTTAATSGAKEPCSGDASLPIPAGYTPNSFSQWQTSVGEDKHSAVKDPHFARSAYPYDNYSLLGWPGVGFLPFDPNEAGRYLWYPRIEPPAIAPTFVTANYNPATDY